MTYDVHAHIVPAALMELLRSDGRRFGIEVLRTDRDEEVLRLADRLEVGPFPKELFDLGARITAMDEGGVDVQLVSHRTDLSAYALEADAGARYARAFNEILADEVSGHAGRMIALGTVPLQAPKTAAEELDFVVRDLGMAGVEIASTVDGVPLDLAELDPFWEVAAELRCFVLLHPYDPLRGVDLSRYFLENIFGRPAESALAIAHLLFSGTLERYPDLVLCMVHGGGYMPYQLGRWEKGFRVASRLVARDITRPPLDIARRLYYDSLVHLPEALSFLLRLVGPSQVVVGTDYPYPMHERHPVAFIDSVPDLSPEARQAIMEGNVRRILDGIRR